MAPPHPAHHTPPSCPVCFHHAASLAPSSSSHSRSRRNMLKRASPALEHSGKDGPPTCAVPGAGQSTGQRLLLISMGSSF